MSGRDILAQHELARMPPVTRGTLVVDELVLPISDVRLQRGRFVLVVDVWGPTPAVWATSYTVHDEGGAVVYRSLRHNAPLWWPEIRAGSRLSVMVDCEVWGKESGPAPQHGPGRGEAA